jgi:hypothetical protein
MKFVDIKNDIAFRTYEVSDRHNWTKEELEAYHYAEMRRQDEKGKTEIAVKKATEKREIEIAKEMIKDNEPIDKIIKNTKLCRETVEKLINEFINK